MLIDGLKETANYAPETRVAGDSGISGRSGPEWVATTLRKTHCCYELSEFILLAAYLTAF
ncbi:MAG: hypothetical protein A2Z83_07945 [Omnitrophica bacterium GWA2_52_8]|nr:MAG: hypothetical protein A2Z83_07945 [Omnitrophica bacterium GWA2_52_8]